MALDFSRNGYETTFKNALSEGISLFCGAGFSVESFDSLGNRLPVGDGLLVEMKKVFPEIKKIFISAPCMHKNKKYRKRIVL